MSIKPEKYKIKLLKKQDLTNDVYSATFSKPKGFDFIAGQYIQFLIPKENKIVPKSFSIASTPDEEKLEFCIKKYPEGVASEYIYDFTHEDEIKIRGPLGRFNLQESPNPHNFIATGVGIAPTMSMIKQQLKQDKNADVNLLFGLRHEEDIFWTNRLNSMKNNYRNFSYQITLSQPKTKWRQLTGRVTKHLNKLKNQANFYICGNRDMVKDVRKQLKQTTKKGKVNFEIF